MPKIIPIRDLRDTSLISEMAHNTHEPIFVTKNGYSDLVIMSEEVYEKIARTSRIDQAIEVAEKQIAEGKTISLDEVIKNLNEKFNV